MDEFVKNELYRELMQMPLWVTAAFSNQGRSEFYLDEIRIQLIVHLVVKVMDRCPSNYYDKDYRINWKTKDFIQVVKGAYEACVKASVHTPYVSYTMEEGPTVPPKYQVFMYDDKLFKRVDGRLVRLTDAELKIWNTLPESERNWSA